MIACSALAIILGALLVIPALIGNHKTHKLNRIGLCISILGIFVFAGGLGSKYYLKNKIYNQYFNRTDMQQILKNYPQTVLTNNPNYPNDKNKHVIVLIHEKTNSNKTYNTDSSPILKITTDSSTTLSAIPYTSGKDITINKSTIYYFMYTKDIFKQISHM